MSKPTESVKREVSRLIEPILADMGFELVYVEYLSEHGRWVLRIYVDEEGGITLEDCARVSREIGNVIDVKEIVPHEYVLEVSSPGLNRPLVREKDFNQAVGKKVKLQMINAVDERRNFTGYLKAFKDGTLHIQLSDKLVLLPRRDVKKANLVYEFEN
ncbi:MAG: ribosome maturation factor RimP [Desulfatiglandaceae bacterium]|jgi:ribosome maturation factor RimP